jgi:hypothetical protein
MRRRGARDLAIAALAAVQHSVVSRAQLLMLGLTNEDVDRRVRMDRLHRVHYNKRLAVPSPRFA